MSILFQQTSGGILLDYNLKNLLKHKINNKNYLKIKKIKNVTKIQLKKFETEK
jgi:hypothetical protein